MAPKAKAGAVEKTKKPRAKKDPNAPKGASGPYIHFSNKHRDAIRTKHPEWKIGEIGRELGSMWKAVSDEERKECGALADKDKARYAKENAAYLKSNPSAAAAGKPKKADAKKAAPKKEKAAPKQAAAKAESDDDDEDDEAEDSE